MEKIMLKNTTQEVVEMQLEDCRSAMLSYPSGLQITQEGKDVCIYVKERYDANKLYQALITIGAIKKEEPEKKVFISGSRSFVALPVKAKEYLEKAIKLNRSIIVGDNPNGVDMLVQQYLKKRNYNKVTIYYSCGGDGYRPRYNAGFVSKPVFISGVKPFVFYSAKDKKMAEVCYSFITIWDRKSKGTRNNIERCYNLGKKGVIVKDNGEVKIIKRKEVNNNGKTF